MTIHVGGFRGTPGSRTAPLNVLMSDGHYIHCGQPMQAAGGGMRNLFGGYSERELPDSLGVYLATRVLRCACGFQMEIPDAGGPG